MDNPTDKVFNHLRSIAAQAFELIHDIAARREFTQITNGARTVPQIAIDGKWIGGFTELTELHMEDELDDLVE